jgi:hypothetical protein
MYSNRNAMYCSLEQLKRATSIGGVGGVLPVAGDKAFFNIIWASVDARKRIVIEKQRICE